MTPPDINARWARAYHRQAASDFETYKQLAATELPRCHALHYLQMTTEKLAKAYRLAGEPDASPMTVRVHTLGNFVQLVFRSPKSIDRLGLRRFQVKYERRSLADFATAVSRLAPAVAEYLQPRNVEYPWEANDGAVLAPIDDAFADFGPSNRVMRNFLSLLSVAIEEFVVVP